MTKKLSTTDFNFPVLLIDTAEYNRISTEIVNDNTGMVKWFKKLEDNSDNIDEILGDGTEPSAYFEAFELSAASDGKVSKTEVKIGLERHFKKLI